MLPPFQAFDDVVEVLLDHLRGIRLLADQAHVEPDGVSLAPPGELSVVGDHDQPSVVGVYRHLVVGRGMATRQANFGNRGDLMTGGSQDAADPDINVVIEQEPHEVGFVRQERAA